jgi:tetratricopeptide (TPR) repeat protein
MLRPIRGNDMRSAVLMAGLCFAGCATTSASDKNDGAKTATKNESNGQTGADQPQIGSKAKMLFDDALKSWDAQKKARTYDYPSLEKKFRAAADADPNLAEAVYNLGVLAERQGKTKEAVSLYKDALSRKPTLKQAAENLGVIAQNNGDEATATRVYTDILSQNPDDASSRARLAELSRRKGDLEKAIALSREALFREPKTLQAYKTMMLVYFEQKQFAMARLIALRASKIDDSDPEIPYTLGLMNLAEKDSISARVNFKKAVAARPDYLPGHFQLCKMALDQEDYQGAEEHLRRILQANGKNAEALLDLGVAYKGMGQLDKAMATYDEAAKANPDLPELLLNRGIIIAIKGDPEKAISMFKQYIARKSETLTADHPVHTLIEDNEKAIEKREEEKRISIEAAKMEEEMKKVEAAAAEEEKKKKEADFQKQKSDAKGEGRAGSREEGREERSASSGREEGREEGGTCAGSRCCAREEGGFQRRA